MGWDDDGGDVTSWRWHAARIDPTGIMTLKILSFSTLYPNVEQPVHGVFVENRLRKLVESGEAQITMVAPVPWFPFKGSWFGGYGRYARVPDVEHRFGIDICHPRYLAIPKVGMNMAARLMIRGVRPAVRHLIAEHGPFDLVDSHYFYPDGVAAVALATEMGLPVCVTARGTDVNLIPDYASPRAQITRAAQGADAIITVCDALQHPYFPPLLGLFRPCVSAACRALTLLHGRRRSGPEWSN